MFDLMPERRVKLAPAVEFLAPCQRKHSVRLLARRGLEFCIFEACYVGSQQDVDGRVQVGKKIAFVRPDPGAFQVIRSRMFRIEDLDSEFLHW